MLKGTKDGVELKNGRDVKINGNSTVKVYAGKRRNVMATLRIQSVKDNAGKYYADGKQLSRVGKKSKCRVQALDQFSEEETEGGHDELLKTKQ